MIDNTEKEIYFPREKFFVEAQDLIASFFSTGNYFTENIEKAESYLSTEENKNDFFYSLLFFSLISNSKLLIQKYESILKHMKSQRRKKISYSEEQIIGDIDIDKYVQKNYLEKNERKIYPSIIHYSNYQLPEYQLSLLILIYYENFLSFFLAKFKNESSSLFFKTAFSVLKRFSQIRIILQSKYGINYNNNETIPSLIKKVEWRYRSKKIVEKYFIQLINLYKDISILKGIDLSSSLFLDYIKYDISFDDRLYEIWLLKITIDYLHKYIDTSTVSVIPLYEARKKNIASAIISAEDYDVEIYYQNRKHLLSKEELKWYWNKNGTKERIGAIPDIVLIKKMKVENSEPIIVLLDAKQRKWEFEYDMQRIKGEIVQQIYILDNFRNIFANDFKSVLIAHNNSEFQTRKYFSEDNENYIIDVISLNLNIDKIDDSIIQYMNDIIIYLRLGQ